MGLLKEIGNIGKYTFDGGGRGGFSLISTVFTSKLSHAVHMCISSDDSGNI